MPLLLVRLGIGPRRPNWMFLSWRGNACGGAYSSAPDLLQFALALRDHRLLDEPLTETLIRPHGPSKTYGYGFQLRSIEGQQVIGHGGGGAHSGIDADLRIFWDTGLAVVVLANYDSPAASDLSTDLSGFLGRRLRIP